ncbi:hypothetical protein ACHAXT_013007 [Thalassiosira profunda]
MRVLPLTVLLAGAAAHSSQNDEARGRLLQRKQSQLLRLTRAKGAEATAGGKARHLAKHRQAPPGGSEDKETPFPTATPPSSVSDSTCGLCPDGLAVPDGSVELPAGIVPPEFNLEQGGEDGAYTCGMALEYASTVAEEDDNCRVVQLAGMFCCPPGSVVATPASSEAEVDTAATTEPTEFDPSVIISSDDAPALGEACVCSPRSYTMKLDLPRVCDADDLETNDGVGLTLCVVLYGDQQDGEDDSASRLLLADGKMEGEGEDVRRDLLKTRLAKTPRESHLSQHQLHKAEIYDIQFLEFGAQGELTVIHQEDLKVLLKTGDSFSFDSISKDLDGDLPLGEQAGFVPAGVQLTMRGRLDFTKEDGTVEEKMVNQRVTWSYTNDCDGTYGALPVMEGDAIGWVTFESLEDPASDFCPIAPTTTSTTTTSTATTTSATVDVAPPSKLTDEPTAAPAPEMSMVAKSAKSIVQPASKAHKQIGSLSMLGKSGKSGSSKGGKVKSSKQSPEIVDAKAKKVSSSKGGKLPESKALKETPAAKTYKEVAAAFVSGTKTSKVHVQPSDWSGSTTEEKEERGRAGGR